MQYSWGGKEQAMETNKLKNSSFKGILNQKQDKQCDFFGDSKPARLPASQVPGKWLCPK